MAKKVCQIRWFGDNNSDSNVSMQELRLGESLYHHYPIVQLGVQTLPGTRLLINNSETPLTIGATGIYELNIDGLATITSLIIDGRSLNTIADHHGSVIIDYIYDEEG